MRGTMSNIKLVKGMFTDRPTLQRGSRDYGISKEFGLYLSGVGDCREFCA